MNEWTIVCRKALVGGGIVYCCLCVCVCTNKAGEGGGLSFYTQERYTIHLEVEVTWMMLKQSKERKGGIGNFLFF